MSLWASLHRRRASFDRLRMREDEYCISNGMPHSFFLILSLSKDARS